LAVISAAVPIRVLARDSFEWEYARMCGHQIDRGGLLGEKNRIVPRQHDHSPGGRGYFRSAAPPRDKGSSREVEIRTIRAIIGVRRRARRDALLRILNQDL
jgi:hypothetical protein